MRLGQPALAVLIAMLCACGRPQPAGQPNAAAPTVPPPGWSPATAPPAPLPPRQRPAIDPTSSEAAEDVARAFVELVNRGHFDEAYMLLGPGAPPRSDFDRQFGAWSALGATLGQAGDQEGAAGSSYITIPVQLSGRINGQRAGRSLDLVLRRVNDVPGSTEAQRHWHIERIDAPSR